MWAVKLAKLLFHVWFELFPSPLRLSKRRRSPRVILRRLGNWKASLTPPPTHTDTSIGRSLHSSSGTIPSSLLSMFNNNNSLSISVSDEDEEEPSGKMRVRVRRKRKKSGFRGKNELRRLIVKQLLRWWPVLLFLPAAALLLFEATRIGRKTTPVVNNNLVIHKKDNFAADNRSEGNLNRLDPTTRVVGGVRTRKSITRSRKLYLIICVSVDIGVYE